MSRAHTIALFEPAAGGKRARPAIPAFLDKAETALAVAEASYTRMSLLQPTYWIVASTTPVDECKQMVEDCREECVRVSRFHQRWERTLRLRLRHHYDVAAVLGQAVALREETRTRSISTATGLLESGSSVTSTVRTQERAAAWALMDAGKAVNDLFIVLKRDLPEDLVCKIFVFAGVHDMRPRQPRPAKYVPIVLTAEDDDDLL